MASVNGKVALVTGASSRIGKASAEALHEAGFVVYATARRPEKLTDLKAAGVRTLRLDVTDEESMIAAVAAVEGEHGAIDVLVNNAGFGLYGAAEDVPLEEARHQFEVNVFRPARLNQLVLPNMRRQGSGTIVNISSMGGEVTFPLGAWYHASKHALEAYSDALRQEVKRFGIDVVLIQPGFIKTEFGDIASQGVLEHSCQGAYRKLAEAMAKSAEQMDGENS
jgi:NAD(P)-dependent dehydrogenase (short-subunit alcohol dehydrogenase family)